MKRAALSQFGFNTIELLVGVAILAIVALAGATLLQVANQATNYPQRKQELQSLGSFIMQNFANEKTCTLALSGNNLLNPNSNGKANGVARGRNRIDQTGRVIYINNMANLQAGPAMDATTVDPTGPVAQRQFLTRRLQLDYLDLENAVTLGPDGNGNTDYLAGVYLEASEIGSGFAFKPVFLGSLVLKASAAGDVVSCQSMPSDAIKAACQSSTGLGCQYDPNSTPSCRCIRSQRLCTAPGYYPVGFTNGEPDCRPLGGGVCSNANEYLVGIELEKTICAPVPTTCPTGTSTTGAGNPVAGLINCKCNNPGETYYTGTGCA